MTMSALVTGGSGFLGAHLVRRLVADGHRVHLLVRASSSLAVLGELAGKVTVTRIDSETPEAIADAIDEAIEHAAPNIVYSLAVLRDHGTLRETARMVDANVRLPILLIAAAAERHVPLITTASYMYGDHAPAPSLFSASRAGIDPALEWATTHRGLAAVTLALTTVYGPGDTRHKVVNVLRDAALTGSPVDLVDPERCIDLVHVDDVVDAYLHATELLRSGHITSNSRFDVSSGTNTTLRELVARLEDASSRKIDAQWGARPAVASDSIRPPAIPRWLPGWKPRITLDAGLRNLIRASFPTG